MSSGMDAEQIEADLKASRARLQRLAAQVEAEEGALVRTTLAEAEVTAAARRRPVTTMEQQLMARVTQAEQLLSAEHDKLKSALADPNVQLALAVEDGVDKYYADVHTLRQQTNPAHGLNPASMNAGATLRKLNKERQRLNDAVRSLIAETEMLAAENRVVVGSKADLVAALKRRDAIRVRQGVAQAVASY